MTPIGLAANKQLMDNKFNLLVREGSAMMPNTGGTIYKAAYHAYYDAIKKKMDNSGSCSDADIAPLVDAQKKEAEIQLQNEAHDFAKLFNDAMKECLQEISDQIDAHIKSMMINIITAAPGPSGTVLASAVGPVSGTISVNNLTPTGGITIS